MAMDCTMCIEMLAVRLETLRILRPYTLIENLGSSAENETQGEPWHTFRT